MNHGIGNVKGKSSGGAIPTITIELSQMLSQTEVQLTNEQFEIIANNSFISVALPTGQVWGFNRVQDDYGNYHLAMCVGSSTEISYTTGDIDSTTKIITISMGDFSGGGGGSQLYKHNILITILSTQQQYGNWRGRVSLIIENDNNTPITTWTAIKNYMISKNITQYIANGEVYSNRPVDVAWIELGENNTLMSFYGVNVSSSNNDATGQDITTLDAISTIVDVIL